MVTKYASDTKVKFYDFTKQYEEEEAIVQSSISGIPLVLPLDAMEIVDALAAGETVGEARDGYQQKYGEIPDIEDLLILLEDSGFVCGDGDNAAEKLKSSRDNSDDRVRYHFADFPQPLAQKIFDRKVLFVCAILIGVGLVETIVDPSIIPGWRASFFQENLTLMRLILTAFDFITLFAHEMAHSIAAKSYGVSSRLGISHRLWHLVAETDMTGVWGIPRQLRFLPILAGSLLDTVCASILVSILFLDRHTSLALPPIIFQLLSAMLLIYLMRLLWQCYFFIRTDFYYVFTTWFNCKSLLGDTEVFLQNKLHRVIPRISYLSQSHIPAKERRIIRLFSILWIGGRVAALLSLAYIELPLLWNYCLEILRILSGGYSTNPYAFLDAISMTLLIVVPQAIGFWLWFQSLYRRNAGNLQ